MNRMRLTLLGIGVLLAVMVASAACDASPEPASSPKPTSTPIATATHTPTATPLTTPTPTPVEPAARKTPESIVGKPMVHIAERVPGFRGAFLDASLNTVYIYLQDASMQVDAERVLTEVYGPDYLAGRDVEVIEGDYIKSHVAEWHENASGSMGVTGVVMSGYEIARNRIEFHMYPRRGGRAELEATIAAKGVPLGAVTINIGNHCDSEWPSYAMEAPDETLFGAMDFSAEAPSRVSYGDTVQIKLALRNDGDEPVTYSHGRPPYDFDLVVTTSGGELVWYWKCGKIWPDSLQDRTLEPGEEVEFVGEWEQVDNRGEPVPPATYLVRGVMEMGWPEAFVTAPMELEVLK